MQFSCMAKQITLQKLQAVWCSAAIFVIWKNKACIDHYLYITWNQCLASW